MIVTRSQQKYQMRTSTGISPKSLLGNKSCPSGAHDQAPLISAIKSTVNATSMPADTPASSLLYCFGLRKKRKSAGATKKKSVEVRNLTSKNRTKGIDARTIPITTRKSVLNTFCISKFYHVRTAKTSQLRVGLINS